MNRARHFLRLSCITLAFVLAGCAAERAHREGVNLMESGQIEEGLAKLAEAMRQEPGSARYRSAYELAKARTLNDQLQQAEGLRAVGKLDVAETVYRRVQGIERNNDRARAGLAQITRDRVHQASLQTAREAFKAGDVERTRKLLAAMDADGVQGKEVEQLRQDLRAQTAIKPASEMRFKPEYDKPVSLEFRNAGVGSVLESLSRATGVSFILDRDVRPDLRTTVFFKQVPLDEAIDFILQTSRLEKKVLNRNTVLIYPNTPEKLKEYQELQVRTFYVARGDAKQIQTSLKGLLNLKNVVLDEKLNALLVRDTPEALGLAERLIAMQDLSEPEVMLEVEVMEVSRSRLTELGVKYPNQVGLSPLSASGSASNLTLRDLKDINDSRIGVTVDSAAINLRRELTDSNLLANPRIRARNRQKAKVLIGDRVPVITTTTTATGFTAESVQYLDVGLKLEVEPAINLRNEVAINVNMEVSSLVKEVRSSTGSLSYQIGTRGASTLLQLRDGETQILAGLISDDERKTAARIPLLGDLPLLGRLFGSQRDDGQKTEIVLAITPHIVRPLGQPDVAESVFWSGTEQSLRARPMLLSDATQSGSGGATKDASTGLDAGSATAKEAQLKDKPSSLSNQEPANVQLRWGAPAATRKGEAFEVQLMMKSDGGVKSLPLQVAFDPKQLQLQQIKEGRFFRQADSTSIFSSNIDNAMGRAVVTAGRVGSEGLTGDDSVVTLVFRATESGKTDLKLLVATPISAGQNALSPALPAPLVLDVAGP